MTSAPKPTTEFERLKALRNLKILDSLPEDQFDELTLLASIICKTPIALISLVDQSRQWFKSKHGLVASETPRDIAFCAHAILEEDIFLVNDATTDSRFSDNPLVTDGPEVKFYAGVPLTTSEGHKIGTLCVLDQVPRELDEVQLKALKALSNQVMSQLELRTLLLDAEKSKLRAETAKIESDEAASIKTSFLANMSHEIRTPMNGIIGMTDLLLDTKLTEDQRDKLLVVHNCGTALLGLINDILDFSKLEAEKMEFEQTAFDPRALAKEINAMFKPLAEKKGLQISYEVASDVPQGLVGDPGRLRQIIYNLVCNALKFTQKGSVSFVITKVANDALNTSKIQIAVKDSGIGIPKNVQDRLFKTFSQVDASTTRRFGGTGLGLSISKGLCEKMGGQIWVESVEDEGSTFIFTFLAKETDLDKKGGSDVSKLIPSIVSVRKLKVLVAEDNMMNQTVIKAYLTKLNYEIDMAGDGIEALEYVKMNHYDLILMDCHMPKMGGLEATQKIREILPATKQPRIIALTAGATVEERKRCLDAGMDDFLSKPLRFAELHAAVVRFFPSAAVCPSAA